MKKQLKRIIFLLAATIGVGVTALITDIQRDLQIQKVISLYGPDENQVGGAIYNDGILNIPDEQVCMLNQLWIRDILGAGNTKFELNDKKCIGFQDGKDVISGIVNLSSDPVTGNTSAKIWMYDPVSRDYGSTRSVISYVKVQVTTSPTSAEPFGRFKAEYVAEDSVTGELLSIFEVEALGAQFKTRGKAPLTNLSYVAFVDGKQKKGVYKLNSDELVRLGYDNNYVCFKRGSSIEDCFPRALARSKTDPLVKVRAFAYGIYNSDGTRYMGPLSPIVIDDQQYILSEFGGWLSPLPGALTQFGSWVNKEATMNGQFYRIQWISKEHSVDPAAAVRLTTLTGSQISLDIDPTILNGPGLGMLEPSNAKSIGEFPISDWRRLPVKLKDGIIK